jgi:hypothetical protein
VLGGVAFVAIGILGFVPGVTSHYSDLHFSHGSHAQLFGVFRVSIVLNVIHVLAGVAGVVVARTTALAVASFGLWLLGVVAAGAWLSLDSAENWLHFVLGIALLGLGSLAGRDATRAAVA